MLLLLLLSCHAVDIKPPAESGLGDTADTGSGPPSLELGEPVPPSPLGVHLQPALDPILGAAPLTVDSEGPWTAVVVDASGAEVASVTTSWDGRDASGNLVPAGPYTVRVVRSEDHVRASVPIQVVRCGFDALWAEDDGGVSATWIPLYWHESETLQDSATPVVSISALDDSLGNPVPFPSPATNLDQWVEGANHPQAFSWDSRPILRLRVGEETVLGSSGLMGAGVRAEVPGWTALSGADPLEPGVEAVFQADEPLASSLGVYDEDLTFQFLVRDADGADVLLGTQAIPVEWYAMLGAPTFTHTEDQYAPWPAFVDPALRGIDGTPPDHDRVVDALTEWIFRESGLRYDTRWGASAYVNYERGDWGRAHFFASDFVDRHHGTTVNCTDCASILLTYANMLGASLNYTLIFRNFALNYILAIGGTEFSHCPFGSGGCSFSYHAVTTDDGSATIWDATLALDGDDDPGSTPNEELLVQTIPGEEYLDRLVMSGDAWYEYETQGTLQ